MPEYDFDNYDEPDPAPSGYCAECGDHVQGVAVDMGIGAYEYWGARGVDTDIQFLSPCCEAEIKENPPMKLTQCDELVAKETFSFRASDKGRSVTAKKGDVFWVVSSSTEVAAGVVRLARKGKNAGNAYAFTPELVEQHFMTRTK